MPEEIECVPFTPNAFEDLREGDEMSDSSGDNIFGGVIQKDGWKGLSKSKSIGKKSGSDISWPNVYARMRESNPGNYASMKHKQDLE